MIVKVREGRGSVVSVVIKLVKYLSLVNAVPWGGGGALIWTCITMLCTPAALPIWNPTSGQKGSDVIMMCVCVCVSVYLEVVRVRQLA